MKNLFLAITIALAGCTAAEAATTEECCMPPNQGQIFASGISILLKGPNQALQIADGNPPVKYLHFVGVNGQTIAPTYEPDGLDAGQGSKIGGAKLVMVSAAELAALTARVDALEAKEMIAVGPLSGTAHNAAPNSIVCVNMEDTGGPNDFTITLPAPTPEIVDSRIRVVDVSADGGVGAGTALKISGTFAPVIGGGYLTSPYTVANDGFGASSRGAWVELVCRSDGWLVIGEGKQPMAP